MFLLPRLNIKGIIATNLTAIFKNNIPRPKTLDILSLMFGEVKYQKETEHLSYAEFYDGNGEMVASYSNGGWTFYGTKEENARESKLLGIGYNARMEKCLQKRARKTVMMSL